MCGIVGQANNDGRRADPATLQRMCAALEHRGPDSRGLHVDAGVGLGIQRLRVIDLATGDQPIFNEDRSVAVVLNGEIYNYRELRERLQRRGHSFATQGDTEVIAHLYEEEGPRLVERLHGMFGLRRVGCETAPAARWRATAWARSRSTTPSAAARSPSPPSSRALLEDDEIPRDVDHRALDAFLAYRWVPAPMTAFRAVRKLPPASTLVFQDGRATISRYWQLDFSRKRPVGDLREVHEELREQIRAATAPTADLRRAARRLPLRRRRLRGGGGRHGRGVQRGR